MSAISAAFRRSATTSRIAYRELRRRPRDAALVVAMVSLPVAIVMAAGVVTASGTPTHAERVAAELGTNQAWIMGVGPAGSQVFQTGDAPEEISVAGGDEDGTDPTLRDPRSLLPADVKVIPIAGTTAVVSTDDAAARLPVMRGASWDPIFGGKFTISEGAAPTAADEVMVSPGLMTRFGLALGDSLTIGDGAGVRVVGVLAPTHAWDDGIVYGTAELDPGDPGETTWYVGSPALDSDTITALTTDGFQVFTRDGVPQNRVAGDPSESGAVSGIIVGGGLGLIEVVLLAGAAFAVGMRRRQHTLALIAATGAQRRELVGIGLASGAWHGAAAGIVGVPVGLLAGWAWLEVLVRWGGAQGGQAVWGYHVVPWHVLAALAFGVLASLLASLIPAIASSGVDVMASLRGSQRPRITRLWPAAVGGVLLALSVVTFGIAAHLTDAVLDYPTGVESSGARAAASAAQLTAVALAFVGAIMVLPKALGWLARIGAWLGVGARIAARDAARNAGRTVPVVAAIAVTVALGAGTYLAEARYDAASGRSSYGELPLGMGQVNLAQWGDGDTPTYLDPDTVGATLEAAIPGVNYAALAMWQDPWSGFEGPAHAITVPPRNVCVEYIPNADGSLREVSQREMKSDPNCANPLGSDVYQVAVGDARLLTTLLGSEPSKEALDVLASGGVVAFAEGLTDDGRVTITTWDGGETRTNGFTLNALVERPAARFAIVDAMVSPETAAAHGITTQISTLLVSRPGGLTQADADAADAVLVPLDTNLVVQTEVSRLSSVVGAVSLIAVGVIALFATALALGLARAEARRDDFTLASLGASPALAKRAAGWQAALTVFVALAIGFGIALAMDWVRAHEDLGVPFAPPWWNLVAALVVLPAAVGVICGLATRAPKAIHYRLAA